MSKIAILMAALVAGPRPFAPSFDYAAAVEQAEREHRPLAVFMGVRAEKLESDDWVAVQKDIELPLTSINIYMPNPQTSKLEFARWTTNAYSARCIVQEEFELRGYRRRQTPEPSLFDWIPRMRKMPVR